MVGQVASGIGEGKRASEAVSGFPELVGFQIQRDEKFLEDWRHQKHGDLLGTQGQP